jgi:hypothetical protein
MCVYLALNSALASGCDGGSKPPEANVGSVLRGWIIGTGVLPSQFTDALKVLPVKVKLRL